MARGSKAKIEGRGWLSRTSYRFFGGMSGLKAMKQAYNKTGIPLLYEAYLSIMVLTSLAVLPLSLTSAWLIHVFLLRLSPFQALFPSIIVALVSSLLSVFVFVAYPSYRVSRRAKVIDSSLIYTVGYSRVLALAGLSIERILERISEVDSNKVIREMARRAIADVRIFGLDVVSSLDDLSARSASQTFSKLLEGITNTMKTSGNLAELFAFETGRLYEKKLEELENTIGMLAYLGEIYVSLIVVSPIIFILMLTILSVLGGNAFGLPPVLQINIIVLLGIPVLAFVFAIILDSILREED